MTALDWLIVSAFVATLVVSVLKVRRFGRTVAGFLAANRCAGRYLICVAYNMAQVGIITLVWFFQQYYDAGFTSIWWGLVENPVMILIALSGWVIYRFRETRALTLAQFLERRYSRRFRIFCGMLAFVAGVLNYAIFPAVSARFLIWLCGLPPSFTVVGYEISTFVFVMAALLSSALAVVFLGGQVAVMVADFVQGVFCNVAFLLLSAWMLLHIGWDRIGETLLAQPLGHSMVNPLGIGKEAQFNGWYWLISAFTLFYTMRAWQGDQGYNAAALTPHEAKMAQLLSGWRWRVLMLVTIVVPVCAKVFLTHPDFAADAASAHQVIDGLATTALQAEARVPLTLGALLPVGLLGIAAAAMFGAYLSTDDTYLHSWGSIFVQDVVLPIRAEITDAPMSAGTHLLLLRLSILSVAIFAFCFGLLYEPAQYVAMWGPLTAGVFVAAAGSVIIGGLYWSRGTTAAAWSAMLVGMFFSLWGILAKEHIGWFDRFDGTFLQPLVDASRVVNENRWLSGQVLAFGAMAASIATYVGVSLLGPRRRFDLDRMLFRGAWRNELPESERDARDAEESEAPLRISTWMRRLGFTREYSRADTWVTWITVGWPLAWTLIFIGGTLWALRFGIDDATWLSFWHVWTWLIFGVGCVIVAWFAVGGVRDLVRMWAHLKRYHADARDDGTVEERR